VIAQKFRFHGYGSLKFVYSKGKTVRGRFVSLKFVTNPRRKSPRLSVVVSKKVSKKSPVRNRMRRRIYEVIRLHWPQVDEGIDMVVTVFDERVATMPSAELKELLQDLFAQAKLLEK
jgi:ribonuclease P protein component